MTSPTDPVTIRQPEHGEHADGHQQIHLEPVPSRTVNPRQGCRGLDGGSVGERVSG